MATIHRTPTTREFALNEAAVFNEALARDLTAALAWCDDDEVREAAEHAVRMADRIARFIEMAQAAA
jgi:predicted membrane GTPase involved in stress response